VAVAAARDRRRRQVLRGMVDENIETIQGLPLGSLRRQRRQRMTKLRRWLLVGGSSLLAVTVALLWLGSRVDATPDKPLTAPRPVFAAGTATGQSSAAPDPDQARRLAERLAADGRGPLVPEVIPLAIRRVALDPGHGGRDGGTSLGYGLHEKDLTMDIANRLARLLEGSSCEVVLTRTGDETVSLKERAEIANASRADIFISIHINWLPDRNARGVETYYLGTTDDPFLTRLAAAENRDSGFSMADFRSLLEGVYADVRQDESSKLASGLQTSLYETLRAENPQIVSRGVMTAPFVVLVATEMPAVLAEVACLSNDREARLLAIPRYRQRIAEALFGGITSYARTLNPAPLLARDSSPEKGS
jgi:N-acetylmuramoyl-L-alanine amidase